MGRQRSHKPSGTNFPQLEPRIRQVSAAVVKKKWRKLPPSAQENVRELLSSLKGQTRPVKLSGKALSAAQGEDALVQEVAAKLIDRLPRMPFPPSTHDESFDFELNLHRTRALESQLALTLNSIALLKTQIKREERMLEKDKREVALLEESLRSNDSHRTQQLKSLHPLAQEIGRSERYQLNNIDVSDVTSHNATVPILNLNLLQQDTEARSLLDYIHNHVQSLRANTSTMEAVVSAIDSAKQALLVVEFMT